MKCIAIMLIGIVFFTSCGNKNKIPSQVLPPNKMEAVLWDVIKAEAFTTQFIKKDSTKKPEIENYKLQQKIFALHHISEKDFYTSYDYYKKNSSLLKNILDSMGVHAQEEKHLKIKPFNAN